MSQDIVLPEVQSFTLRPRFFKNGNTDMVEVSAVGTKDTNIFKVQPKHMAMFPEEWRAYCDGRPFEQRPGTALTEIMAADRAEEYVRRNVHNLEELSALSDGQCQGLGHGTLTLREAARKLLAQREMAAKDKAHKAVAEMSAKIGPRPAEAYAGAAELDDVKKTVNDLANSVNALVQMMSERRGRKKAG